MKLPKKSSLIHRVYPFDCVQAMINSNRLIRIRLLKII